MIMNISTTRFFPQQLDKCRKKMELDDCAGKIMKEKR